MEIRVASTERALIRALRGFLTGENNFGDGDGDGGGDVYFTDEQGAYLRDKFKDLSLTESPLDSGDVLLVDRASGETCFAVERKSLDDLHASIFDGRYQDQAVRLHSSGVVAGSPRQVIYLIECDGQRWSLMNHAEQLKWNRVKASLMIAPGHDFLLLESQSVSDSAFKLLSFATRALEVLVDYGKKPEHLAPGCGVFFADHQRAAGSAALGWTPLSVERVQRLVLDSIVVERKRQFNIAPEHFLVMALGCVPGVGPEISRSVGARFPTMQAILTFLSDPARTEQEIIDDLANTTSNRRRIGESVARNIARFVQGPSQGPAPATPLNTADAAAAAAPATTDSKPKAKPKPKPNPKPKPSNATRPPFKHTKGKEAAFHPQQARSGFVDLD